MSAIQHSTSVENDALLTLQKDLEKSRAELENARKETAAAKQKVSEHSHQVASLVKEVEKVKSELAFANTTLEKFKDAQRETPVPASTDGENIAPALPLESSEQQPAATSSSLDPASPDSKPLPGNGSDNVTPSLDAESQPRTDIPSSMPINGDQLQNAQ